MEIRRPEHRDLADVLALVQAYDRSIFGDSDWTETELREDWDALDLARDAWLVELGGEIVGYAALYDKHDGRYVGDGYVHPSAAGRGVGSTILRLTEERARERATTIAGHGRVTLQNATLLSDTGDGAGEMYRAHGYAAVRHFWRMVVDHRDAPPPPAPVTGIAIEPYDDARDARAVHAAIQEAFRDHWGHRGVGWEEWDTTVRRHASTDHTLWWVARAGGQIAGAVLASWKRRGDWGYVDTLGVRRPWRGRGVGEALLRTAFVELWRRGERRVALAVDAQNDTGATALYERVGMEVLWRAVVWEKELGRR